jgi:hypothetical protein
MLDGWHEFYILLGTAAAALVALLFVAVSIGAGFLSRESASATRTFMSPIIFHYASVLFLSLIALIPTHTAISLATAIGVVAAVGLLYSVIRDPAGDTADALAYGACPLVAYAGALAAAWLLLAHAAASASVLATALLVLLLVNIRNAWDLALAAGRPSTIGSRALIPDRHLDLGAGLYLGERLHIAERPRPDVARAREPGLIALRNRRAAEADGDGVAIWPVGDLARLDHRARIALAGDLDRNVEINLFAPGQRRAGERQCRGDGLCRRRIERLGIERDRAEIKADAHGKSPPRRSVSVPRVSTL